MRSDGDGHMEVARRSAAATGMPETRQAQDRAVGDAGRHVDRQRFGAEAGAAAVAGLAAARRLAPGAAALGARGREEHVAADGLHAAGAGARDALGDRRPRCAGARTDDAHDVVTPRDGLTARRQHRSERHGDGGVNVGAARRTAAGLRRHEHAAEEVAERRRPLGVHARREVEAGESGRARRHRRDLAVIVAAAALGIDERLVGGKNVAEPLRRFVVTRIDVGVIAARETLVGTADVVCAGPAPHAEHDVEIHD
jgi:hypothetical protein